MKEISKITVWDFTEHDSIYVVKYLDNSEEQFSEETFYAGQIISDAIQHRTVKEYNTHNCIRHEYFNPRYYLRNDV